MGREQTDIETETLRRREAKKKQLQRRDRKREDDIQAIVAVSDLGFHFFLFNIAWYFPGKSSFLDAFDSLSCNSPHPESPLPSFSLSLHFFFFFANIFVFGFFW